MRSDTSREPTEVELLEALRRGQQERRCITGQSLRECDLPAEQVYASAPESV
jgi:hypothetical protein